MRLEMRIAVYRWLGNNAGDHALQAGLSEAFGPGIEWRSIDVWEDPQRAIEIANSCDALVVGGGTIVGNIRTWILDPEAIAAVRVPVGMFGTGIRDEGLPKIQPDLVKGLHALLSKADPIGVRGPLSKQYLEESGFGSYPIRVIGDAALMMSVAPSIGSDIGINVRARKGGGERVTVEMIEEVLLDGRIGPGARFTFFSCHDDWDLHPAKPVWGDIVPYQGLEDLVQLIGGCGLIVSERLHGAVLANMLGLPTVMLCYERKCMDYAESVRASDLCVPPGDTEALRRACSSAAERVSAISSSIEKLRGAFLRSIPDFLSRVAASTEAK